MQSGKRVRQRATRVHPSIVHQLFPHLILVVGYRPPIRLVAHDDTARGHGTANPGEDRRKVVDAEVDLPDLGDEQATGEAG